MTILINTNSLTIRSTVLSEAIESAQNLAREGVGSDLFLSTPRGERLIGSILPRAVHGITLTPFGKSLQGA